MHLLAFPDRDLLAVSSTSPEMEDSRFVQDVRAQFRFILRHAGVDGRGWWKSVFGDGNGGTGNPLVFRRGERGHVGGSGGGGGGGDADENAGEASDAS